MLLIGQEVLETAARKNTSLRKWLEHWAERVRRAEWMGIQDVRADYPSADGVKLRFEVVVTVFNVKGNTYRLLNAIDYESQTVAALDVLAHAEYSKAAWKLRY